MRLASKNQRRPGFILGAVYEDVAGAAVVVVVVTATLPRLYYLLFATAPPPRHHTTTTGKIGSSRNSCRVLRVALVVAAAELEVGMVRAVAVRSVVGGSVSNSGSCGSGGSSGRSSDGSRSW